MLMSAPNQELPETTGVLKEQENPELEEMLRLDQEQEATVSQTDSQIEQTDSPSDDPQVEHPEQDGNGQTDSGMNQDQLTGDGPEGDSPQTESKSARKTRTRKKTEQNQTQSDTEGGSTGGSMTTDVEEGPEPKRKRAYTKPSYSILSIDERLSVETAADKAKNDLLDLLESQKTGHILSGTIQGIERPADNPARSLAVIYHGDFKIIIPAEEAVEPPDDFRGRLPEDVLHYMLTKRLGAEVDYIVKGMDPKAGLAVGSRLEAMRAKRKQYYLGTDRDGNNLIHSGICAEARVVSVIRAGIFVDLFGLEVYIPLRELSYQRLMDAAGYFQPGQRILVKILEVDRSDRNQIKVSASVKQAGENPYEQALKKYTEGNRYVGTVSMVDTNGVFVALDGGIDCLCSYPKRGRPPRGARVTVRILGINHETNRIWGAITHIAAAR